MRQIILDTETTGLDPKQGHRIIEVAGVEFVNRRPTGRHIHFYLNPEREIDSGATDVHGLTWDMLRDKLRFADVVDEFLEFARGAQWIIHNAPFDIAFIDEELKRVNLPLPPMSSIRWRWRANTFPARRTVSTRYANGSASPTLIERCTAPCSTPSCWPKSISR